MLAAGALQVGQGVGAVARLLGLGAQVAQHGTGFHRGELVFVAQHHQPGGGGQGLQQGGHQLQVDHRSFIDDEHVQIQRVGAVVLELAGVGPRAQQGMHGLGLAHALGEGGQVERIAQAGLQVLQRLVDGLAQPGRCLAGGRGQRHLERVGAGVHGQQQGQQAGGGVGFAGAWPAGDDGEPPAQGQRTGHLLPVHLGGGAGGRVAGCDPGSGRRGGRRAGGLHTRRGTGCGGGIEQAGQPVAGLGFVHGQRVLGGGVDGLGHLGFVARVAAQVQQRGGGRAAQHERLATVGLGLGQVRWCRPVACGGGQGVASSQPGARIAHQRAGQQGLHPVAQGGGQAGPDGLPGHLGRSGPGQQGLGLAHQRSQGQAGVAPAFQVGEQGGGHQQHGAGRCVLPGHEAGHRAVEPAQPALVRPVVERGQPLCGGEGGRCGWVGGQGGHAAPPSVTVPLSMASSWSSAASGAGSRHTPWVGPWMPRTK